MAHETLYTIGRRTLRAAMLIMLTCIFGAAIPAGSASAQNRYVYFPTANPKDGHFLSIAGAGFQTLAGDITLKIASPGTSPSVEIGIFDGETSGLWDYGNIPLTFTLYADPAGNGSGTVQLAQWVGATMPDNAWFSQTIANTSQARGANGDYFYMVKVTTPNAAASFLSVFKVRTTGTVAVTANQPFAYIAPLNSLADAQTIYPNYPTLTPTTYDGVWNFYLDIQSPLTSFEVWDGDMDHGSYDCTENDTDDPDTPNEIPSWAVGSAALAEGMAGGGVPCVNASGTAIGGSTTSNPPDDSQRPTSQRSPNVSYEVIDPNGVRYLNSNPSGNVEWERFRIDVATMDRAQMDYHASSIPPGIYQIRIAGVDMSNLNAWRFPYDAIGVDSTGAAVLPIHPYDVHGIVFYDANSNGVQENDEPGLADVDVLLSTGDTVTTDSAGSYKFEDLDGGSYTVRVDATSLSDGLEPVSDFDGVNTPHTCAVTIGPGQPDRNVFFGYKRPVSAPGGGGHGTHTWQYWSCKTNNWPISSISLGCIRITKSQAIYILRSTSACNARSVMLAELIAAKLNLANGNSNCISRTIDDAEDWLARALYTDYRGYDNSSRCNNDNRYGSCDRRSSSRYRSCGGGNTRYSNNNYCNTRSRSCAQAPDRNTGVRLNDLLHRYNAGQGCPSNMR